MLLKKIDTKILEKCRKIVNYIHLIILINCVIRFRHTGDIAVLFFKDHYFDMLIR